LAVSGGGLKPRIQPRALLSGKLRSYLRKKIFLSTNMDLLDEAFEGCFSLRTQHSMSHQPLSDGFGERRRMTGLSHLRGQVGGEILSIRLASGANPQITPDSIEGRGPHGGMHPELGEDVRFQAELLAHIGYYSGGKLGGIREQSPLYARPHQHECTN
jgi:hypothetical protein